MADFFLLSIIQPSGFRGSDYLDFNALFEQGKYVTTSKCTQVKYKGPNLPKELSKLALYRLILVTLRTIPVPFTLETSYATPGDEM